jgi:hypothetical protein
METMNDGENKPEGGDMLPGDEDDQTTELSEPAIPPGENEAPAERRRKSTVPTRVTPDPDELPTP